MPDSEVRGLPTGLRWRLNPGDNPFVWSQGTSFPPNPVRWERCFREDIRGGMEFFWDGTYWLSTQMFTWGNDNRSDASVSANTNIHTGALATDVDYYVEYIEADTRVDTTNNGSHYWTFTLYKFDGSTSDSMATFNTASDTVAVWTVHEPTPSTRFIDTPTETLVYWSSVKTGTPGTFLYAFTVYYRLRAT